MLTSWIPNTLPPPYGVSFTTGPAVQPAVGENEPSSVAAETVPVDENIKVDENDFFPKGKVVKYFPYQGYGYVLDRTNKEVFFRIAEMDFVGPKEKTALKLGSIVGYDVSWTSSGLHIKKMKVY